jgi:hypothetical protein
VDCGSTSSDDRERPHPAAELAYHELCARNGRPPGRLVARVFPPQLPPGPERDALVGEDPAAASAQLEAYARAGADELVISWAELGFGLNDVVGRWERFAEAIRRRP